MSPSNLQGLNIVQSAQHSSNSHELLLSQVYPDLAAQLDLWKNLAFNSDEPIAPRHEEHEGAAKSLMEEEARSPVSGEKAVHHGHINIVTPANVPATPNPSNSAAAQSASLFDIDSFLNSLGIDAFTAHTSQLQRQSTTITPSLAQLLVLRPSEEPNVSTAKRARTRRVSVTSTNSNEESLPPNLSLSPAEDKRRRNTVASARFRLKKKEREAALEGKAKELETRVNTLERECEDLRRENGWLKGLVVGVTGAAQGPTSTGLTASPLPPLTTTAASNRQGEEPAA